MRQHNHEIYLLIFETQWAYCESGPKDRHLPAERRTEVLKLHETMPRKPKPGTYQAALAELRKRNKAGRGRGRGNDLREICHKIPQKEDNERLGIIPSESELREGEQKQKQRIQSY